jgi:hypothetical protein
VYVTFLILSSLNRRSQFPIGAISDEFKVLSSMTDETCPSDTPLFFDSDYIDDTEEQILLDGLQRYFNAREGGPERNRICLEVLDKLKSIRADWYCRAIRVWFNNSRDSLGAVAGWVGRSRKGLPPSGERKMSNEVKRGLYPIEPSGSTARQAVNDDGSVDDISHPSNERAVRALWGLMYQIIEQGRLLRLPVERFHRDGMLFHRGLANAVGSDFCRRDKQKRGDLDVFMYELEENGLLVD